MSRITVLLVTSSGGLAERVRNLLAGRTEVQLDDVVEESRAVGAIRAGRPDVALLDASRSGEDALRTVRRAASLSPSTRSLLLEAACGEARAVHVIKCGAAGCLPIGCSAYDLVRAIRLVHEGELWATRRVLASTLRQVMLPARIVPTDTETNLSKREREIVQLMHRGMSNKEIGRLLGISDMTVKTHAHNIFNKLEVSGRLRLFGVPHVADPPLASGI